MSYPFLQYLTPDAIHDYTKKSTPTGDWVSYRHPDYAPNSSSMQEGRFNVQGSTAYYLASGIWVAQKEVPNYHLRDLYMVSPHEISYLDLYQLSLDCGFHSEFLRAKEDDGWKLCQVASQILTQNYGLSGISYASYQAHKDGELGINMVILPQQGSLVGDTFFIKP